MYCLLLDLLVFSQQSVFQNLNHWHRVERGRYCAEVPRASILVCAARHSPAKALNPSKKALNLHSVQPKISKHVVKVK